MIIVRNVMPLFLCLYVLHEVHVRDHLVWIGLGVLSAWVISLGTVVCGVL